MVGLLLSPAMREQGVAFGVVMRLKVVGVFVEGVKVAGHGIKSTLDGATHLWSVLNSLDILVQIVGLSYTLHIGRALDDWRFIISYP